MAIITLKQLLHRPSPGAPISPENPMEVRLYGANGQPIGGANRLPVSAEVSGSVGVTGDVDISDREDRKLGEVKATLTGQINDIADNRPEPDAVPVGTVYWSVDTRDVSVSIGAEWRSLGVA